MKKPIFETSFSAKLYHHDPFRKIELDVIVTHETGKRWKIPAFWRGDNRWSVRIYAPLPGRYEALSRCNRKEDAGLHGVSFAFEIDAEAFEHPLYRHGRLHTSGRAFLFEDGTPFYWLGDTWWMALSRFRDDEFAALLQHRTKQGFSLIQLVAGLYPDMDAFDPRGESAAGYAWQEGFTRINPAFFDMADKRIEAIVDAGMVPCIFGMWGYYALKMGETNAKRHWRYLIARWSAYPVVWSLAGEVDMPWYLSDNRDEERRTLKRVWSDIARYVKAIDPYRRPLGAHPIHMSCRELDDAQILDMEMLQVSHGEKESIRSAVTTLSDALREVPDKPVVMSEINYEGILGKNGAAIQRESFWTSVLNGASGFTYGANGIWQVNREGDPFGNSPGGNDWGRTPWDEAMHLKGAEAIAVAARWLRTLPWHRLRPMNDTLSRTGIDGPFCAGEGARLRLLYGAKGTELFRLRRLRIRRLSPRKVYEMIHFDPLSGESLLLRTVRTDARGTATLPRLRFAHDWILLLRPPST